MKAICMLSNYLNLWNHFTKTFSRSLIKKKLKNSLTLKHTMWEWLVSKKFSMLWVRRNWRTKVMITWVQIYLMKTILISTLDLCQLKVCHIYSTLRLFFRIEWRYSLGMAPWSMIYWCQLAYLLSCFIWFHQPLYTTPSYFNYQCQAVNSIVAMLVPTMLDCHLLSLTWICFSWMKN